MVYECTICEKVLPTRTGIWNHLKTKHGEIIKNSN
jgi:hypothetical protein